MATLTDNRELAIRRQFSAYCKTVIHNAAVDYLETMGKQQSAEISMEELSDRERNGLIVMDRYDSDLESFAVCGKQMKVDFRDERLVQAVNRLSDRKKEILLLSVVEQETDTRIAEMLQLDRSTVSEHRRIALAQLKHFLMENEDEK